MSCVCQPGEKSLDRVVHDSRCFVNLLSPTPNEINGKLGGITTTLQSHSESLATHANEIATLTSSQASLEAQVATLQATIRHQGADQDHLSELAGDLSHQIRRQDLFSVTRFAYSNVFFA